MGPLSRTPAHLDTEGPKGWAAVWQAVPGLTLELCVCTRESTWRGIALSGSRCGSPHAS